MTKQNYKLLIKNIAWAVMLAIFFLVDRYLKFLAVNNWTNGPKKIFSDILTFSFAPNYNIAFSLPLSGVWLNILIIFIIAAIIGYLFINKRHLSSIETILFFGIIIGALSNFLDRLKYGYVVDYLDLKWFTVFNLADVLISISTVTLVLYLFRTKKVS